ncbi:galactosyl transferase GMA12/MNN10 family-domain-containing protein [Massariosphaeria phaeospora]|uniref:Galactosyl transferase GMA12/MNN10 family-domain-containing protein n=1 Tax=Massariosphaeria phaeospora TaxID=100035 RepID=A0A7C8IDY2_9PLEO|nr:galactosyl transferase GMA12/MNN10 family-domain-containing protein [Massariosphaeria phaeospora]
MRPRRAIVLALAACAFVVVLFKFFGDVPIDYYRNYSPAEAIAIAPPEVDNTTPQPGYFKFQPEWNWEVPASGKGWNGYAKPPRNSDIVVLTASDGGGHNAAIPNVLERVLEDRQKYCDRHGYRSLWLNTSRYDIGEAHRTWSKIPAVAEAFYLNPSAEWIWLLDTDIILMNPDYDLVDKILSPDAIKDGLMRNTPILDGQLRDNPTGINTPQDFRVEDIDILITQDHQSVNTGSMFFRRTAFTRWLLEMMTDYTLLMGQDHGGAEQDAVKHLMLEHELVRNHVGVYPQRQFNSYVQGGDNMGYRDGDLAVHLAGCWVGGKCHEWFEEFWGKKGHKDEWRPVGHR